jgi:hypothetical protein
MIYAIKAVGTEYVKIGVSLGGGPARIAAMQTGCPFELVLIAQAEWPHDDERRIHAHLKRLGLHVRGEWFKREGDTVAIIEMMRNGRAGMDDLHKRLLRRNHVRIASS